MNERWKGRSGSEAQFSRGPVWITRVSARDRILRRRFPAGRFSPSHIILIHHFCFELLCDQKKQAMNNTRWNLPRRRCLHRPSCRCYRCIDCAALLSLDAVHYSEISWRISKFWHTIPSALRKPCPNDFKTDALEELGVLLLGAEYLLWVS